MKSIIFVTTATSGSASIWRVLEALLVPEGYRPNVVTREGEQKLKVEDLDPVGRLYLIRGLAEVAPPIFSRRFRYVVNFRDPRDVFCNQYHWLVQHPPGRETGEKAEKILAQRRARHALGIDEHVLRNKDDRSFSLVFELQAAAEAGADILFVSYAQLCCAFDTMVNRLTAFLDTSPGQQALDKIALESPENLTHNPRWIGQTWTGTDIMPGRFREELKPETIATLNKRFSETLDRLKALDIPELRHLYDADGAKNDTPMPARTPADPEKPAGVAGARRPGSPAMPDGAR